MTGNTHTATSKTTLHRRPLTLIPHVLALVQVAQLSDQCIRSRQRFSTANVSTQYLAVDILLQKMSEPFSALWAHFAIILVYTFSLQNTKNYV